LDQSCSYPHLEYPVRGEYRYDIKRWLLVKLLDITQACSKY
jgi:hypothetical protein